MKIELQQIKEGLPLDPAARDFDKSVKGYPSFMKPWLKNNKTDSRLIGEGTSFKCDQGPSEFRVF